MDLPIFVKDEFDDFYKDMFTEQVRKENGKAVFLEYAWDMAWCDPCAADPLSQSELRQLGVMWFDDEPQSDEVIQPMPRGRRIAPQAVDAFVTRLHVRYTADTFPEDLEFQVTGDRENYQGRYVLRHPWLGDFTKCEAARDYANTLVERWDSEAKALAKITGWDLSSITKKMADGGYSSQSINLEGFNTPKPQKKWWHRLWGGD